MGWGALPPGPSDAPPEVFDHQKKQTQQRRAVGHILLL